MDLHSAFQLMVTTRTAASQPLTNTNRNHSPFVLRIGPTYAAANDFCLQNHCYRRRRCYVLYQPKAGHKINKLNGGILIALFNNWRAPQLKLARGCRIQPFGRPPAFGVTSYKCRIGRPLCCCCGRRRWWIIIYPTTNLIWNYVCPTQQQQLRWAPAAWCKVMKYEELDIICIFESLYYIILFNAHTSDDEILFMNNKTIAFIVLVVVVSSSWQMLIIFIRMPTRGVH